MNQWLYGKGESGEGGWEKGVTRKLLGMMALLITLMWYWFYRCIHTCKLIIVHFKHVPFILCQLHLNKVVQKCYYRLLQRFLDSQSCDWILNCCSNLHWGLQFSHGNAGAQRTEWHTVHWCPSSSCCLTWNTPNPQASKHIPPGPPVIKDGHRGSVQVPCDKSFHVGFLGRPDLFYLLCSYLYYLLPSSGALCPSGRNYAKGKRLGFWLWVCAKWCAMLHK